MTSVSLAHVGSVWQALQAIESCALFTADNLRRHVVQTRRVGVYRPRAVPTKGSIPIWDAAEKQELTDAGRGTSMGDSRRVIPQALLAVPMICGLVACNGSSGPAPASEPPPVPTLVSVTVKIEDTLPKSLADARVEITSGDDAGLFVTPPPMGEPQSKDARSTDICRCGSPSQGFLTLMCACRRRTPSP